MYSFESSDKSNGVNFPSDFYLRLSPTPQRNRGFLLKKKTKHFGIFEGNFLGIFFGTLVYHTAGHYTDKKLFDFGNLLLICQNESMSTGPLLTCPKDIKI